MKETLLILLLLTFLQTFNFEAAPRYFDHKCNPDRNYTRNSNYQNNLKTILASLSGLATYNVNVITAGYATATIGQGTPDTVYGQYLCRGDVSTDMCRACVKAAGEQITQRCPHQLAAIIWFHECTLRYSNVYIFTYHEDNFYSFNYYNIDNATHPVEQEKAIFEQALSDVIPRASNSETAKKFAVGKKNITKYQTIYVLAQCVPDISSSNCSKCLVLGYRKLELNSKAGGHMGAYCHLRYGSDLFYNESGVLSPVRPFPAPSPPPLAPAHTSKGRTILIATIIAIVATITGGVVLVLIRYRFIRRKAALGQTIIRRYDGGSMNSANSFQFDLSMIKDATNNFSLDNKLGEGGFGMVYKGTLPNGENVAVKRLSPSSKQGANEFQNEATVVAKLQHRNLVRLYGFCLEEEERLLVYEFVPNRSLDYFLFDPQRRTSLDWSIRYQVLKGIAKGMLYLHEDSRLRIIHRDLKASNILLDNDMNPKVSDFGLARIIGVNHMEEHTAQVVGTQGYLAPEYAMQGQLSVKVDVYSFGILLLEIISGKRSRNVRQSDDNEILSHFVWRHWRDGTPLQVIDPLLGYSFESSEAIKCIKIGLLCVHGNPADRPTMAKVVYMLNSQNNSLDEPRNPELFDNNMEGMEMINISSPTPLLSRNEVSITELYPR